MVHSEYIAETDMDACIHCGECIERCIFGARKLRDGQMVYNTEACLGCGLCISVCSVEAISMNLRKSYPE
jgi:heterodisulfide reductase subunit A-like polyferredoxin